ncbi:MAG: 23S rRNA (guanosine(2251)-2'-O)-methyltransferase RlmB [Bacteroidales bacterium]|nr:23S rRNA (guanosine(2251)-2'-O)-methyltransferase RlmB [Bacteroidales bacterium]
MEKQSFLFGIHPVIEAFSSGREIDKVLIKKGLIGENVKELMELIRKAGIPYQVVPIEKLNRITRKNHQGVIAFAALVSYSPIEEIVQRCFEHGEVPLILALDGVTDVRNFGAIVRSAEIAGAHAILVPDKGSAQINPEAMKSSAGALNILPIARTTNLPATLRSLRESGLKILGATEKAARTLYNQELTTPLVIVMGSEEDGLSGAVIRICDELIKVPQKGKIASLNVSATAAVLLFETLRQRMEPDQ